MAPGSTCKPVASKLSFAGGMASSAPTASTAPSLMATLPTIAASGETMVPLRMTRSAVVLISCPPCSQHGPAAVDRQIDPGNLAGRITGKKQTGIGDVAIHRDALERIFGGVALGGFCDADIEPFRHVGADLVTETRPVDHARRDAIDVDVVLADFERKAFGDAAQAPFRCRIGHAAGAAAHAEGASDIDDLAVALRDHGRQYAAHGVKRAVHVERDDGIEFFRRGVDAGLADRSRTAGDIDQNVDATVVACLGLGGGIGALLRIG